MDLSFNGTMEAYYQKFIELQEKLRKSEEERLKLEMKFNEMLQITREEEQAHYRKLRSQYKRFLEEDRKRQDRNERIIRTLERIEARVNMLTSKTDRFKVLKRQYHNYLQRILLMRPIETEYPIPKIEEDIPKEQQTCNISEHNKDLHDHSSLKKALGKSNDEKIEILDKYLQSLSSQKCKDAIKNNEKVHQSDLNQLKHLEDISKKIDDGFNSNQANSIAEDIMKSIYSRHYKKELLNDETKKANKFTAPNNDIPLKQKTSGFGDSYKTSTALENVDNDAAIGKDFKLEDFSRNRSNPSYAGNIGAIIKDSEFEDLNKIGYTPREGLKSLSMYKDKEAENKEINSNVKALLANRSDSILKNKDYHVAADSLVKSTDYQTKVNPLLKNEDYQDKNNSEYQESNQIQRQVDPLLFRDMNNRTGDITRNDSKYLQGQIDPLLNTNRSRNKVDSSSNKIESQVIGSLLKEKFDETKDFSRNELKNFNPRQNVIYSKLNDGPSKTEIDIIENEKKTNDNKYYNVPSVDDIQDGVLKQHDFAKVIQDKIENPRSETGQEYFDDGINAQSKSVKDQLLSNKIRKFENNEESYISEPVKQENNTNSIINEKLQEIEPTVPDEGFNKNEFNQDEKESDINQLVINSQSIPKNNKIDIQNNEGIKDGYEQQYVINDDQSQYVANQEPAQYDQYENPIQYDNQINYNNSEQALYDESEPPYDQNQHYDGAAQHYGENSPDIQYDDNGQPIHSYNQQYDENGQPILYEQQYDTRAEPVQQLYDDNGQVLQQYDQNEVLTNAYDQSSHPVQYDENGEILIQYDETGQLIQQYNDREQPIHLYDQSDQPVEYIESNQPIQEYGESVHLSDQYDQGRQSMQEYDQPLQQYEKEQYNSVNQLDQEYVQPIQQCDQDRQSVQDYEQPFQQYENEQPVEQYDLGNNQLDQEYIQPFQQYDANGQPIQQYDENKQSMQQYDENGHPMQQYDENGQPIQQYDDNGQPMQQYDENGHLMQQYDENEQPIQQYDENGQPMQQYDENGQPMQQYDENGQPLYQYDENVQQLEQYGDRSHHYDENDRLVGEYDKNNQPIQQHSENVQLPQDVQILEKSNDYLEKQAGIAKIKQKHEQNDNLEENLKTNFNKNIGKEDINQTVVEGENQSIKQKNVLDMLDTDTESVKQNTSKISNDSDFDFSN